MKLEEQKEEFNMLNVFVNGVEQKVYQDSFSFSKEVANHDRLSFVLDNVGLLTLSDVKKNNTVDVIDFDGTRMFFGFVYDVKKSKYSMFGENDITVECVGLEYILQTRYFKKKWEKKTVREIFDDSVAFLGLSCKLLSLHSNEVIDFIESDNGNFYSLLDNIINIIGGYWYLDVDFNVHMIKEGFRRGPDLLKEDIIGDVEIATRNDGYANVIKFPNAFKRVNKIENKIGTGSDTTFTFNLPIEKVYSARVAFYNTNTFTREGEWTNLSVSEKGDELDTDIIYTEGSDVVEVTMTEAIIRVNKDMVTDIILDATSIPNIERVLNFDYEGTDYSYYTTADGYNAEIETLNIVYQDIYNSENELIRRNFVSMDLVISGSDLHLSNNHILELNYDGLLNVPYEYSEADKITEMMVRSNGVLDIVERSFPQTIIGYDNVLSVASKIYSRITQDLYTMTFNTYKKFNKGDTVKVINDLLEFNNQDFTVISIDYKFEQDEFLYGVTLVQGNYEGDWSKYFSDLEIDTSKQVSSNANGSGYVEVDVIFSQLEVRIDNPTDVQKGRVWMIERE
jgi:hypothetical protein